jgi:hypothetical protein
VRVDAKPVNALTPDDLARFPVWEYDNGGQSLPGRDETWVVPVPELPVTSLSNRVVGVSLRSGCREWAGLLGNVELNDPRSSREFAIISVWRDGTWFHLARYFDVDFERRGPEQLAEHLGLRIGDVFPLRYDLVGIATGHAEVVRGRIEAWPAVRLTDAERMAMIFGR